MKQNPWVKALRTTVNNSKAEKNVRLVSLGGLATQLEKSLSDKIK